MSSLAGCNDLAFSVLRDDHYPSFNVVKWQSSDLIGSLKSRLAVAKNDKNIAVSHQTLPSARREKRRGTRLARTLRPGHYCCKLTFYSGLLYKCH